MTMETMMTLFEIETGRKFHDDGLKSQPPEYRVHVIKSCDSDGFDAEHVASGTVRRFARTEEAVASLRSVGTVPAMSANLDFLVGERIKVELTMGSILNGKCTAVRYRTLKVGGHAVKYVQEIELDKSGGSSYPLAEIKSVQIVQR